VPEIAASTVKNAMYCDLQCFIKHESFASGAVLLTVSAFNDAVNSDEFAFSTPRAESGPIFNFYMGKNTPERKDYIMDKLVVPVEE
jgi:hypothetical protein